eukprot:g6136.t1
MESSNRGSTRPPPRGRQENSHALPKGTLPKKLQLFFAPRLPLPYFPPMRKKKPALAYTGVAQYLGYFEEEKNKEQEKSEPEPDAGSEQTIQDRKFRNPEYVCQCRISVESKLERDLKKRKLKIQQNKDKVKQAMAVWDPKKDPKIQSDPFKTLFLARISYQVTERDLKKIFGAYGSIRSIRIVRDSKTEKSRGYAFVEYEHVADMKDAYKHTDGTKIDGRRVLVDVERGRTMEGWRPAKLGGGLGAQSRRPKPKRTQNVEQPSKDVEKESRSRGRDERDGNRRYDSRRDDTRSRSHRDRPRERDYGSHDRSRRNRDEKRYRDSYPDHDDRSGKKRRELEEGEVDHHEARDYGRRRERDM